MPQVVQTQVARGRVCSARQMHPSMMRSTWASVYKLRALPAAHRSLLCNYDHLCTGLRSFSMGSAPAEQYDFDLITIGAGSGGTRASRYTMQHRELSSAVPASAASCSVLSEGLPPSYSPSPFGAFAAVASSHRLRNASAAPQVVSLQLRREGGHCRAAIRVRLGRQAWRRWRHVRFAAVSPHPYRGISLFSAVPSG